MIELRLVGAPFIFVHFPDLGLQNWCSSVHMIIANPLSGAQILDVSPKSGAEIGEKFVPFAWKTGSETGPEKAAAGFPICINERSA